MEFSCIDFKKKAEKEPYKNIWEGCLWFISLCDLVQAFPDHSDAPMGKDMIYGYADQYLLLMSQKNSFGLIPYGLYTEKDPEGNRKTGS